MGDTKNDDVRIDIELTTKTKITTKNYVRFKDEISDDHNDKTEDIEENKENNNNVDGFTIIYNEHKINGIVDEMDDKMDDKMDRMEDEIEDTMDDKVEDTINDKIDENNGNDDTESSIN